MLTREQINERLKNLCEKYEKILNNCAINSPYVDSFYCFYHDYGEIQCVYINHSSINTGRDQYKFGIRKNTGKTCFTRQKPSPLKPITEFPRFADTFTAFTEELIKLRNELST